MTHVAKPKFRHHALRHNALGLTRRDYEGVVSTLCAGCGHDSVSAAIVEACFRSDIEAHRIAKVSGIGCSSKTTNYFLNQAHGFNSVHGRMPSVATGANLANNALTYIGVSGDGDTASIGLGQFCHAIRRHLNMVYIVENNGTYGLTKGQFSATNDRESPSRTGKENPYPAIDLCSMAVQLGAGFVARGFSGDKEQLVPLIQAALKYRGFALIDVVSPCVTFNNHDASTKSFDYARAHNEALDRLDFVPEEREITASYNAGRSIDVALHDGSTVTLSKVAEDYDPTDAETVLPKLLAERKAGGIATGLLYIDPQEEDMHALMGTSSIPLNSLPQERLCPGSNGLAAINAAHR